MSGEEEEEEEEELVKGWFESKVEHSLRCVGSMGGVGQDDDDGRVRREDGAEVDEVAV